MPSNGTISRTIWKNHREVIYLSTNIQQQTIFWAGIEGHLDDEAGHLSIYHGFTVPSAFIVFRIEWRDISVCQREKDNKWDLKNPIWQDTLKKWIFLSAVAIVPLACSLLIDPLSIFEVVQTDDFIVDGEELDAALVPGKVERRRWLGRSKRWKDV